jgi:nicotinate-nucleotide adenylyltransferase
MVTLAAKGENGLVPYDYEVNKSTCSYTAETMTELSEKYPDVEWYFIIGEDSLCDILKWYKPEIIVKKCILLVYPRGSEPLDALINERKKQLDADIRAINAPLFGISSTQLRRRAAAGRSIKYFVADSVEKYIKEKRLYRG